MFQDTLDAAQGLDHVRPVVVQIPQFTIVALVRPPALLSSVTSRRHDAVRTDSTSKRRPPRAASRGDEYKGRRRAPERVLPQDLILLEVRAAAPALVVGERVPVFLK